MRLILTLRELKPSTLRSWTPLMRLVSCKSRQDSWNPLALLGATGKPVCWFQSMLMTSWPFLLKMATVPASGKFFLPECLQVLKARSGNKPTSTWLMLLTNCWHLWSKTKSR